MMTDPKSARARLLLLVGCVVAVSLCTLLFRQRRGEQPIPYHVPTTPESKPLAVPPQPLESSGHSAPAEKAKPAPAPKAWKKPKGFKIVAVIFYGRPRFVNILDCYLRRNLVSQGGYLDEVRFMVNTKHKIDLKWLDDFVKTEPLYKKVQGGAGDNAFDNIWSHLQEDKTMYVKIDDDVIYIHDDAIPRLVQTLQAHPEAHDVAANIINSPVAHWLHYHTDAILPYLPELHRAQSTPPRGSAVDWRPSKLPQHNAPAAAEFPFPSKQSAHFAVGEEGGPPYQGHRWLPLENTSANLLKTPIFQSQYYAFGKGWTEWTIAAQQHYSLLEHLERKDTSAYWLGSKDGIWNMQYERYNLNFLAIWGSSVRLQLPGRDDEQDLTVTIPKALGRPCLVDTHAIIGHFAFGATPELEATDLLDRYLSYANEMVCEKNNQRHALALEFLNSTNWQKMEP